MPQITIAKATGLYLEPNSLNVPEGAFEQLDNVSINQDNIIKKRRGFGNFHTTASTIVSLADYKGYLFAYYTNGVVRLNSSGGVDATYSGQTVSIASTTTVKSSQANGNLYYITNNGVQKIESVTNTNIYRGGIPAGLDLTVTLSGVTGVIAPDTQYGYRVVFGRRDGNNNLLLGAPTELAQVTNLMNRGATWTNVTTTITVTTTSPHGLTTGDTVVFKNAEDNAGAPQASLDITATVTVTGASTFTYVVATAPSAVGGASSNLDWGVYKTSAINASIPADIFNLSTAIGTTFFFQVYRTPESASTPNPDAVDTYVVSEDLQLVQETMLTSTDLSNKFVTFTDTIDDIFLGAFLYTNPNSGEGIVQSNLPPPSVVGDLAFFKNHMFYANVVTDYVLLINMLTARAAIIDFNDTISITQGATTRTYTAKNAENTAAGQFLLVHPSSTVTVSQAVDQTARSLIKVINRDASGLVYAYYTSSFNDAPGMMAFVSRSGAVNFSVIANTAGATTPGQAFLPALPTSGTTVTGKNNSYTNALYISKQDEPEAVPAVNFIFVGSRALNILRLAVLRDSLIVITDQGSYRINGDSTSNFASTLIDNTVPCLAIDSVAVLNNEVYYVSTQGIVAISDTAARIISKPIEPVISAVLGKSYFAAQTRGCAYESEHLYLLSTVSPFSTTANTVYCYHSINNAWFNWDSTFLFGLVKASNDKLYLVDSTHTIAQERKNQNKLDYTDDSFAVTINSVGSDNQSATMTVVGATPVVGDIVVIDDIINRIIEITNPGTVTYHFAQRVNFVATDTGLLYKGIVSVIKTAPQTGGDVSRFKEFSEFQMTMRNQAITTINMKFATDSVAESSDVEWFNPITTSGWGLFAWGSEPWGQEEGIDEVFDTRPAPSIRTYVPLNVSRGTYIQAIITHDSAAEDMSIQSMSYTARAYGHRTSK